MFSVVAAPVAIANACLVAIKLVAAVALIVAAMMATAMAL
jgi:hypothetical protein